jgi:multicomponent Na+:H+ antiporter subunit F
MFSDSLNEIISLDKINFYTSISFSIAILIAMYRLWKGPNDFDRIIGLEFLSGVSVSIAVWSAFIYNHDTYIDVALAIASLSFIGTWIFSKLYTRKETE